MGGESSTTSDARTPDELVGRLFQASVGMLDVMSVHLGDRLGLYRVLHDQGPANPDELAARAAIDQRYAQEWLEQQAATGILDVDRVEAPSAHRRYRLPDAYVDPLI